MGFSIRYRTTRPVTIDEADTIRDSAVTLVEGRTWLSCEPVHFFSDQPDGGLSGFSKPNFQPHPDDVAAAALEELPDGTVLDMIEVLRQLSNDFNIDWELSHDYSDGPIGYIHNGVCDPHLLDQIEGFAGLAGMMGELGDEMNRFGGPDDGEDQDDDDDDGMLAILPFRPRQ